MTEWTTIKVSRHVRDRLASTAQVRGTTIRALLDELSLRAVDDALMEQAAAQMRNLRDTDPAAWADYLRDGAAWEEGAVDRIDA